MTLPKTALGEKKSAPKGACLSVYFPGQKPSSRRGVFSVLMITALQTSVKAGFYPRLARITEGIPKVKTRSNPHIRYDAPEPKMLHLGIR